MTDLTLRRVIDAPVQRVYAAWTDPKLLRQGLAPGDAVAPRAVADVAVGGTFLIEMRGTDGQRWLARGVYREVAPLRRLVPPGAGKAATPRRWSPSSSNPNRPTGRASRSLTPGSLHSSDGALKGRPMHWRATCATSAIRTRRPRTQSAG